VPAGCRCRVDARRVSSRVDRLAGIGRRRPTALDGCRRDRRRGRPGRGVCSRKSSTGGRSSTCKRRSRRSRSWGCSRSALATGSGGSVGTSRGRIGWRPLGRPRARFVGAASVGAVPRRPPRRRGVALRAARWRARRERAPGGDAREAPGARAPPGLLIGEWH
jgi:hypothetical protein